MYVGMDTVDYDDDHPPILPMVHITPYLHLLGELLVLGRLADLRHCLAAVAGLGHVGLVLGGHAVPLLLLRRQRRGRLLNPQQKESTQ